MYCSTALRMNVLLGMSPRTLSTSAIGNVIPHFRVLSILAAPIIPVLYIVPQSYILTGFSFYLLGTISLFMKF